MSPHPPLDWPDYKSTRLRHPAQLRPLTLTETELTSPRLGDRALGAHDHDLTVHGDGEPLGRIAGRGTFAVDPDVFGIAPVEAANRALERAGIGWGDIEVAELNEAFAAQSLACLGEWDLDPGRLNVNGGAIAIGHPLGASGVRILGTLVHELRRRGGGWGIAAICIGVGQGLAVVVEA